MTISPINATINVIGLNIESIMSFTFALYLKIFSNTTYK